MAPSRRSLGVTIKRGRKERTVLHLGVISYEPQELASQIPMRKTTGFVEAPPVSPWFYALKRSDCNKLMDLMQKNPCLMVQKGPKGLTVLHAAAKRGCLKLLDQVYDLFEDNGRFVDENEGIELSFQELLEAKHEGELTAVEYAWYGTGEDSVLHYLEFGRRRWNMHAEEIVESFVQWQCRIFNLCKDPEVVDDSSWEGSLSPPTLLLEVLTQHKNLLPHQRNLENSVLYNFVAECEELNFHYACEELEESEECREYVRAVIGGCLDKGPHVLRYLFQLRNAQGQTPLHVAAAASGSEIDMLVGLIPGRGSGENAECLNVPDSRGWTALHLLASLGLDDRIKELLEDGRADVNATVKGDRYEDRSQATALHLAVIHNESEAVKLLLEDPRTDVNALFHRCISLDKSLGLE